MRDWLEETERQQKLVCSVTERCQKQRENMNLFFSGRKISETM